MSETTETSAKTKIVFNKAMAHIEKNKVAYLTGAVCLTVGVVCGAALVRTRPSITATITDIKEHAIVVVGDKNTVNQVVVNLVERSTASKPVHLVGTNLYFNSISEAARETGLDRIAISRNIAGTISDVKGSVFKLLELAE